MLHKITVSTENITAAVKRDSHRCMIADAIQKQVPWAKYIMVDAQSIRFTNVKTGRRHIYLTPPTAQRALLEFDRGAVKVRPFALTLNQGYTRQMRVRAPNFKRAKSTRRKAKSHRLMPSREREFGMRKLVSQ